MKEGLALLFGVSGGAPQVMLHRFSLLLRVVAPVPCFRFCVWHWNLVFGACTGSSNKQRKCWQQGEDSGESDRVMTFLGFILLGYCHPSDKQLAKSFPFMVHPCYTAFPTLGATDSDNSKSSGNPILYTCHVSEDY